MGIINVATISTKSGCMINITDFDDSIDFVKTSAFFDRLLENLKDRSLKPGELKGGYFQYGHQLIMMDDIESVSVSEYIYLERSYALASPKKKVEGEVKLKAEAIVCANPKDSSDGHISDLIYLEDTCDKDSEN